MDNRWVSADEVSKHLGISKDTVYRWIEIRGLPGHRIGRLWKFRLQEVDRWVRSVEKGSPNNGSNLTGSLEEPIARKAQRGVK